MSAFPLVKVGGKTKERKKEKEKKKGRERVIAEQLLLKTVFTCVVVVRLLLCGFELPKCGNLIAELRF